MIFEQYNQLIIILLFYVYLLLAPTRLLFNLKKGSFLVINTTDPYPAEMTDPQSGKPRSAEMIKEDIPVNSGPVLREDHAGRAWYTIIRWW